MKRLLKYIKPYWKFALLAPLLMAVEVAMDLFQPRLIENIIDVGVAGQDLDYILRTGVLMVGLALVGVVGGVGCSIFAVITAQNTGADLREEIFSKVQYFSFKNMDRSSTGNLITVLTNDMEIFQRLISMGLRIFVRAPLTALGSVVLAFITSPKLSLIIFSSLPLFFVILYYVNRRVFPLFSMVQEKMDQLNSVVQENLAGIRVVKAFVRSDHEVNRFKDTNQGYMETNMAAARTMALVMPLVMLIINLGLVAALYLGGLSVIGGSLKVGQIVSFINYLMRFLFSMTMVGMMLIHLSRAFVSAERISGVLAVENTNQDEKRPAKFRKLQRPDEVKNKVGADSGDNRIRGKDIRGKIEYRNVSFSYTGKEEDLVLTDLNIDIRPGETTAIMGETGSGKSTVVRLIPRLYDVTSGQILIDDINVKKYDLYDLRRQVGFIMQETILFSGSIRDNISYGNPDVSEEEIVRAAKIAQAHSFIEELPAGYNTRIEQRGVNLSGGQKQRVAIARAVVTDPSILIFDDSTSAVDVKTEYRIMQALEEASEDITVIIIAQKISSVVDADRILLLADGKLDAVGTHRELLSENQIYRDIYQSQYGEDEKYA